jgi:thiol-disulfide isomerase/thioredoxin
MRLPRPLLALAAAALVAVVAVGISQAPKTQSTKTHFSLAQAQRRLAGSPPPLAALHAQASQILGGGKDATLKRLAALKGTPVVLNKWASWCGPCRAEFPFLQSASTRFGRRIAFVGLNSGDSKDAAARFLRKFPVPYPSYEDPREQTAAALKASTAYPITIFYDASGKQVYLHQGYYLDQAQLDADLERYLLRPTR